MRPDFGLRVCKADDYALYYDIRQTVLEEHIAQIWGWNTRKQHKIAQSEFNPPDISIIQIDGQDIGVLQVEAMGEDALYIRQILLLPAYQNRGIGAALMADVIKVTQKQKKSLVLHVFRTNNKALRFYDHLGFVATDKAADGSGVYMRYKEENNV